METPRPSFRRTMHQNEGGVTEEGHSVARVSSTATTRTSLHPHPVDPHQLAPRRPRPPRRCQNRVGLDVIGRDVRPAPLAVFVGPSSWYRVLIGSSSRVRVKRSGKGPRLLTHHRAVRPGASWGQSGSCRKRSSGPARGRSGSGRAARRAAAPEILGAGERPVVRRLGQRRPPRRGAGRGRGTPDGRRNTPRAGLERGAELDRVPIRPQPPRLGWSVIRVGRIVTGADLDVVCHDVSIPRG